MGSQIPTLQDPQIHRRGAGQARPRPRVANAVCTDQFQQPAIFRGRPGRSATEPFPWSLFRVCRCVGCGDYGRSDVEVP